jgi:hypothetical protein
MTPKIVMAKKKSKSSLPKLRNPFALHASMRRSVKFKDKRIDKGGQRNQQRELKEEE